jgi:hypothetical protein
LGTQGFSFEIAPEAYTLHRGRLVYGALVSLAHSDNSYFIIAAGPVLNPSEAPVSIVLTGTAPEGEAYDLRLRLEAYVSTDNLIQRIELFDFVAKQWTLVTEGPATRTDSVMVAISTDPQRYIRAGTREVRARLSWKANGPTSGFPWRVSIDQAIWHISL